MTASSVEPTTDLVTIDVTDTASGVCVTASGEIDSSSAPQFRSPLDAALDRGVDEIVIDLCGVSFLDSAGLCVLAAAHRRAVRGGVRLSVRASSRAVIRPMQITGLYDLLDVRVEPDTAA